MKSLYTQILKACRHAYTAWLNKEMTDPQQPPAETLETPVQAGAQVECIGV